MLLDLRLFQMDQIAVRVLKVEPFYARPRAVQIVFDFADFDSLVAKRFVSGQTIQEAIPAVRRLNSFGILTTLDVLGDQHMLRGGLPDIIVGVGGPASIGTVFSLQPAESVMMPPPSRYRTRSLPRQCS